MESLRFESWLLLRSSYGSQSVVSIAPIYREEHGLGQVLEENAQEIWDLMQDPKTHVYIAGLSKTLEAFYKGMAKAAGSEARLRWQREEMLEQGRWSELIYG